MAAEETRAPPWKRKATSQPAGADPLKRTAKASPAKGPPQKAPPQKGPPPSKAPITKTPAVKVTISKQPPAKGLIAKQPAKAPIVKEPAVKAPITKALISKSPAVKAPLAKAPITKTPPPIPTSPADSAEPSPSAASSASIERSSSWKAFEDTDPLYAVLGELGEKKVVTPDGSIDEDVLNGYLTRLTKPGTMEKIKDWVEVWAAMNIPVEIDKQAIVVQGILEVGLISEVADTIGDVLAELVKGHRAKIKAVEEAITTLFECGTDEQGCLSRFLLKIFPKSPTTEWGWSRVGWNWQQWWSIAEKIFDTLDKTSAFESLRVLLAAIETDSGTYLPHQQIWDEKRLCIVREALCHYGRLKEEDLAAAVDVCLS
mmetsp:Transcript_159913/g.298274  ORF Transcript_159913/g.298274 Transcript_159913/m.298274 type:complete len:372 (+) Transcript_159913:98-1213(+)